MCRMWLFRFYFLLQEGVFVFVCLFASYSRFTQKILDEKTAGRMHYGSGNNRFSFGMDLVQGADGIIFFHDEKKTSIFIQFGADPNTNLDLMNLNLVLFFLNADALFFIRGRIETAETERASAVGVHRRANLRAVKQGAVCSRPTCQPSVFLSLHTSSIIARSTTAKLSVNKARLHVAELGQKHAVQGRFRTRLNQSCRRCL